MERQPFNWSPRIEHDTERIDEIIKRDLYGTGLFRKAYADVQALLTQLIQDVETKTREETGKKEG